MISHSPIRPGCIVELMQGNAPQVAWVVEESAGRLRLYTQNKRETKLAAARLLPWTGPRHEDAAPSRQTMDEALAEHARRRRETEEAVDVEQLWDLAQGEVERAPVAWFAQVLWTDPDPDQVAGLGRALLAAKTRFKFQPPDFEVHPADKVALLSAQREEEETRERAVAAGQELLRQLWDGQKPEALRRPAPEVAERLEAVLRQAVAGRLEESDAKLWAALQKGLPEHPHLALILAQRWGILSPHHNHHLDEADYRPGDGWALDFRDEVADHLARLDAAEAAAEPEPTPFLSIDSATTRDIDDAFFVTRAGEGFRLTLALARPTLTWTFGSPLDLAVRHRASSLYLPEQTSHMLPEALGVGRYSLTAGNARPALVAEFDIDAAGECAAVRPRAVWVRLTANLHFDDVEAVLEGDPGPDNPAAPHADQLALARELGERLLARRLRAGAMLIRRSEPELRVSPEAGDAAVEIIDKPEAAAAGLLVQEFMVLANACLAQWASERGAALFHRTQEGRLPIEAQGVFDAPEDIYAAVKHAPPSILELEPKPHAALAAPVYAPITSPIRRYTDLVNCAQICALIEHDAPCFTRQDLEALLPGLSARSQAVGQVQRYRPRYWKLVWLRRHRREPQPAVLVDANGPYPTLSMPHLQIYVRAPRAMLGGDLRPGRPFLLTFGRVDPLTNEIRVVQATEPD
ncbi:MAG: ribonuclease catalytic domain-containing protein [Desulfovibrionaceae bacterium]